SSSATATARRSPACWCSPADRSTRRTPLPRSTRAAPISRRRTPRAGSRRSRRRSERWRSTSRACASSSRGRAGGSPGDGRWIDPEGLRDRDLSRVRAALHGEETDLAALCEDLALELAPGELDFFAHWITPEGIATRFDTRFFLAPLPPSQEARHD